MINVFDNVDLPLNEKGVVIKIIKNRFDWFPYKVKITKGNFNNTNDILEFKETQLKKIE